MGIVSNTLRSALLLILSVVALGCGSGGSEHTNAPTPTPATTPEITTTAPQPTASSLGVRSWAVGSEHQNGVIARSEDGGLHWSIVLTPNAFLSGVQFLNRNDGWAVGGDEILHTTDGGDSWVSQIGNVSGISGTPTLSKVKVVTESQAIAVGTAIIPGQTFGTPMILLTADGGEHWSSATIAPGPRLALQSGTLQGVCLTSTGIGLSAGFGPFGNLALMSTDGGATWSDITTTIASSLPDQPAGVACVGSSDLWIVGRGPARIAHSTDGGATWTDQASSVPLDHPGALFGITFVDPGFGWTSGVEPFVLHTIDDGDSWLDQPLPGGPDGSSLLAIAFANESTGVTVGVNNSELGHDLAVAFATHDGGITWAQSTIPSALVYMDVSVVE